MKDKNTYRVFIAQINQIMIEVSAKDEQEAKDLAYKKWEKEYANSYVVSVEKQDEK